MKAIRRLADALTDRIVPRTDAKAASTRSCWDAGPCPGGGRNICCNSGGQTMCIC